MTIGQQPKKLTDAHMRIIQAGAEIRTTPELDSTDLAFMARQLVQATLPHTAPRCREKPIYSSSYCRLRHTVQIAEMLMAVLCTRTRVAFAREERDPGMVPRGLINVF
jgi:hypothetical protein